MDRLLKFAVSCLASLAPLTALAELPKVQFDMPYAVACRDTTPTEYAKIYPGYRLVEAKLEISALLVAGQEKDLTQYFVRIDSPNRTLSIADYLPKTKHESFATGGTQETSTERVAALGINLSGKYELLELPGPSAGIGEKKTSSVKYELLPPLETVAASGTLDRATALFFKIKSTQRNPLEGTREYALVLRVPNVWRADYIRVHCAAETIRRGMVSSFDETVPCGRREFLVALYQDGDEEARHIAENFARREAAASLENRKPKEGRPADSAKLSPYGLTPWAAIQR